MTAPVVLKEFTEEEVAAHNKISDCWLILKVGGVRKVYDVTKFLDDHPGGPEIIIELAGQDATDEFEDIGHSNDARNQLAEWEIGKIKGDVPDAETAAPAAAKESESLKASANEILNRIEDAAPSTKTASNPLPIVIASLVVVLIALYVKFVQ